MRERFHRELARFVRERRDFLGGLTQEDVVERARIRTERHPDFAGARQALGISTYRQIEQGVDKGRKPRTLRAIDIALDLPRGTCWQVYTGEQPPDPTLSPEVLDGALTVDDEASADVAALQHALVQMERRMAAVEAAVAHVDDKRKAESRLTRALIDRLTAELGVEF